MSDIKSLKKRAQKKIIGQILSVNLAEVAMAKNEPQRAKAYRNTFYCQNTMTSSDNKLYGNYCKNRFCPTCLGIRKADFINRYLPVINTWEQPYFVTLTAETFGKKSLKKMVDGTMIVLTG